MCILQQIRSSWLNHVHGSRLAMAQISNSFMAHHGCAVSYAAMVSHGNSPWLHEPLKILSHGNPGSWSPLWLFTMGPLLPRQCHQTLGPRQFAGSVCDQLPLDGEGRGPCGIRLPPQTRHHLHKRPEEVQGLRGPGGNQSKFYFCSCVRALLRLKLTVIARKKVVIVAFSLETWKLFLQ